MSTQSSFGDLISYDIGGGWGEEYPGSENVEVRVIRGADFPEVDHGSVSATPIRFETPDSVHRRRLQAGDIILEISGGTRERPTGRSLLMTDQLLRNEALPVIPASFCRLLRPNPELVVPAWLHYVLKDLWSRGLTWRFQNQSTGISNFQYPLFATTFKLEVPDLSTQLAIAEVLGALDDKIAANRRAIEIGRALLLAEWQRATSGSTDIVFLEDIASINPRTPVASEPEPPYLDMKNLPEFGLLVSDWGSREPRGGARFQNGDSLLARITPCVENGKMAFVDFLEEGQVGYGSTEYIVLRPKPGIPAAVPYVISANPEFRAAAALLRTGTSGRQRVQGSELASSVIVIPDRESLCEFGKFSQALLKRLGAARTENQILASTRDELLPLLMSGRITVGAASSRVEEVV